MIGDFVYVEIKFVVLDFKINCSFSSYLTLRQNLFLVLDMIKKEEEIILEDVLFYENNYDCFLNGDLVIKDLITLNKLEICIF